MILETDRHAPGRAATTSGLTVAPEVLVYLKDPIRFPEIERPGVLITERGTVKVEIEIDPVTVDGVVVQPERRPLKDVKVPQGRQEDRDEGL